MFSLQNEALLSFARKSSLQGFIHLNEVIGVYYNIKINVYNVLRGLLKVFTEKTAEFLCSAYTCWYFEQRPLASGRKRTHGQHTRQYFTPISRHRSIH